MLRQLCERLLRQQATAAGLQQGASAVVGHLAGSAAISTEATSSSALADESGPFSGGAVASSSYAPPPPRPWSSSSSLAFSQPDVYKVDILIKGFELRFIREASTAIRDLLLVNFAPKGRGAVGQGQGSPPAGMPHVNLELPFGDTKLKTLKTIYTVIRGPHVHKTSREQFAKITHRRRITHHTNNHAELQWFLDCLKLYEFHGVEITVDVVTSTYMQPTTTADLDASQKPLLADHMQQFKQYFAPSPPTTTTSSSSSSSAAASQYKVDLQQLQAAVLEGLEELRYQLQGKQAYAAWTWSNSSSSSGGGGGGTSDSAAGAVSSQLDKQLLGSSLMASSSSSGALQDAAAAAAQEVLQRLSPDSWTRSPSVAAALLQQQAPPSDPQQLGQWLYAILQLDALQQQQQQDLQQPDTAQRVAQAAAEYPQMVAALVYALLRAWHARVVGPAADALGLPLSAEVLDKLLKDQKVVKAAADKREKPSSSGSSRREGK